MGCSNLSGGGVVSEQNDKAEDRKEPKPKKPPGYRTFEKLLKQVVKAPPLKKREHTSS
jgi:hypothetical protein